jgi:hypothetical protein
MSSSIRLTETAAASITTPATNRITIFADSSSGGLAYVDSASVVHALSASTNQLPGTITLGDIFSVSGGAVVSVTGNVSTTRKYLTQTGTGTGSALPQWNTIAESDLPAPSVTSLTAATNLVWTVTGLREDVAKVSLTIAATLSIASATAGFRGTLLVKQGGGGSITLPSGWA